MAGLQNAGISEDPTEIADAFMQITKSKADRESQLLYMDMLKESHPIFGEPMRKMRKAQTYGDALTKLQTYASQLTGGISSGDVEKQAVINISQTLEALNKPHLAEKIKSAMSFQPGNVFSSQPIFQSRKELLNEIITELQAEFQADTQPGGDLSSVLSSDSVKGAYNKFSGVPRWQRTQLQTSPFQGVFQNAREIDFRTMVPGGAPATPPQNNLVQGKYLPYGSYQ